MKKALIAVDGSANARRAVDYAASILPSLEGCEVLLLGLASTIVEESAELDPGAGEPELHGDEDHRREFEQLRTALAEAGDLLGGAGVPAASIQTRIRAIRITKAQDLVEEAKAAGCDTIILGRRGQSRLRALLLGSVSSEVVQKASGLTVWVVE